MKAQNLHRKLDALLASIERKKLLLHSCCAPCSAYVLHYLAQYLEITLFFYNPNITSSEEYQRRREEQIRLISELTPRFPITFVEGAYDPSLFLEAVKGYENEPEGGKRCEICFSLRLKAAAAEAIERKSDYFTTTLSVSPHKDSALLDSIAQQISASLAEQDEFVLVLPSDFKKKEGYKKSIQLSEEFNLYRQDYCGCIFSKR